MKVLYVLLAALPLAVQAGVVAGLNGDVAEDAQLMKRNDPQKKPILVTSTITASYDPYAPYETTICEPCPPDVEVCAAVCKLITTTITPTPQPTTTVICKPCPPGKICPAICIPITTTIYPTPAPKPMTTTICKPCKEGTKCPKICDPITTVITPTPTPSGPITSVGCEPCPPGKICPLICRFTTFTLKPEPTPTTSDCCPKGAQCFGFAPCDLSTRIRPTETA